MINYKNYNTVGDWFNLCKTEGVMVPLQVCMIIANYMKKTGKTFPESYEEVVELGDVYSVDGRFFIANLSSEYLLNH